MSFGESDPEDDLRYLVAHATHAPMAVWSIEEIDKLRGQVIEREKLIEHLEMQISIKDGQVLLARREYGELFDALLLMKGDDHQSALEEAQRLCEVDQQHVTLQIMYDHRGQVIGNMIDAAGGRSPLTRFPAEDAVQKIRDLRAHADELENLLAMHEHKCPNCGHTTRARMADAPDRGEED